MGFFSSAFLLCAMHGNQLGGENQLWGGSRHSLANSFIFTTTITIEKLRKEGYVIFAGYYQKVRLKT